MLRQGTEDKDLRELIEKTMHRSVKQNRLFFDGDHWQNGDGWIGPRPRPEEEGSSETMAELERAFTSANRIEEVCDRHASGVVGREPQWGISLRTPLADDEEIPESDQNDIDEREAALTAWWNERGIQELLHDAVVNVAWGQRSVIRLYVPSGLRDEDLGPGEEKSIANMLLRKVFVDVIAPENATVHEDPNTKRPLGILAYKNEAEEDVLELSYLDDNGDTLIEVVSGDTRVISEPLKLGRRITMHELARRPLITPQVAQQQRAHNLALSIIPRNLTTAGFLERVLINAQQPGHWELDPDTKQPIRFIPSRLRMGAGSVTFIEGIETQDVVTGKTTTATPDVKYRDPVPVDPTIAAERATYLAILEEVQQAHVLMNSEATPSGRSREQARKDFEGSLKVTKPAVERAGRWLLETAMALAEALLGGDGGASLQKYRVDFNCRLDTGVITPEERKQNNESVKAGTLPREYAIAGEGVDDVDVALALINSQEGVVLDALKQRAEIAAAFAKMGTNVEAAARAAGLSEEVVRILAEGATYTDPDEIDRGNPEDDDPEDDA